MKRDHLPALTGLRIVAALLVVLSHTWRIFHPVSWLMAPLANGYLGVDLFFILSGFILTHTYATPEGRLRGTVRAFLVARAARVYPLYLLTFLLAVPPLLWWGVPADAGRTALATLLLVQAWGNIPGWDVPAWSLSCEALFYLAFPLCLAPLARLEVRRLLALAALLWLGTQALASIPGVDFEWPPFRLPEFLIGMVAGRCYQLRRDLWPGWAVALPAAGLLVAYLVGPRLPATAGELGLVDPLCAALIYGLACGTGPLVRLLSHPRMVLAGEASYALYLVHWPLWQWCVRYAPDGPLLPYLALLAPLSLALYRYLETPTRGWLRRVLSPGAAAGPAGAPAGRGAPRPSLG